MTQITLNGWQAIEGASPLLATGTVPGTTKQVTVRKETLGVWLGFLSLVNQFVVPLHLGPVDGWQYRNARMASAYLSNHASGTAVDIHYTTSDAHWPAWPADHLQHCSLSQIKNMNRLMDLFTTTSGKRIFGWGGDWTVGSYCDSMHIELIQAWEPKAKGANCTLADVVNVQHKLGISANGLLSVHTRKAAALTPQEIGRFAYGAGFRGQGLIMAIAEAYAESGGHPLEVSTNHDPGRTRDRGLWQINSHWHSEVTDAQAFNPITAARATFVISRGGHDWSSWSSYHNGAYKKFLPIARTAASLVTPRAAHAAPVARFVVPKFPGNMTMGAHGPAVVACQRGLRIAADGQFGPATLAAVRRFQKLHPGLWPVDGIVGPKTYALVTKNVK